MSWTTNDMRIKMSTAKSAQRGVEAIPTEYFEGTASASSSYNEDTYHFFSFANITLKITSQYFPEGDSYLCPDEDCEAFICHYEDIDEDGIVVCEDCGKEYTIDQLKGTLPQIIEKTFEF